MTEGGYMGIHFGLPFQKHQNLAVNYSALWMQEWLHYEVQMCQGCPKMYSAMFLLWIMLSYSLLSIYAYTCYISMYIDYINVINCV